MWQEFKKFISKGNVIDMAVGVIVGAAFTSIVSSLVKNIINPFIGIFLGKIDLSNLVFKVGNATFKYGVFINSVINFLIIAFVVFMMVKLLNKSNITTKKATKEDPKEKYLKEIVTLLKEEQK
ncbi:large-conductance mechanosensitive channel protein MscL [Fructilactobacillus frigidiflavus]|uniref:large-conductance mechanosensitive channel protein MscL n=1 Tax=Fructilactobacillus frigidiflavus TaxID=3242688 RepID=UPI0037569F9B